MSFPTLWAAASVKCSGGASAAEEISVISSLSGVHGPSGVYLRPARALRGSVLALVNQLTVNLRADRHFNELVLHIADHARLGAELDAFRRADVALDRAVEHDMGDHDRTFNAASLADADDGPLVLRRTHVAL